MLYLADDVMVETGAVRARPRVHAESYFIRLIRLRHDMDREEPHRRVGLCRVVVVDDLFDRAFFDELFHLFEDQFLLDWEAFEISFQTSEASVRH